MSSVLPPSRPLQGNTFPLLGSDGCAKENKKSACFML
uniref:Uncharacterized protein n=1 Tax=Arundo donax TaxID=35708 RepID=A0A0A8ZAS5_ARUDO